MDFVELRSFDNYIEANIVLNMLRHRNINCHLKDIPCPVCKAHALEVVSVTKKHSCKLAALASMILNGHSVEVTKMYRCTHCGYDFKELPSGR